MDSISTHGLTIEGIAAGGEATSLRVAELGIVFDIGVCLPGTVAGRFDTLLLSHGHGDHAAALPYLMGQRSMRGLAPMRVYVPAEMCEALQAIFRGWSEIEGYELPIDLYPVSPGDRWRHKKGYFVRALRTHHRVPSLAYVIEREASKLCEAYRDLPAEKIVAAKNRGELITDTECFPLLCVTGDTRIDFALEHELVRKAKVLVHEITAWDDGASIERIREWGHTHVEEFVNYADLFENESLIFVHRSARHSREEALAVMAKKFPSAFKERCHVFG